MKNGALVKVDLNGFGEAAKTLFNRIFDFVEDARRPGQIIKEAAAVAEAQKMLSQSGIQISDLHSRGIARVILEEGRNQGNIESILTKALPDVKAEAKSENVDEDWLRFFLDKCKLVSNEEMQSLWAKLLAEEANLPGTFSKRTLQIVSVLNKKDAALFTRLCCFAIQIEAKDVVVVTPIVYNYEHGIYEPNDICCNSLLHLEDVGFIDFDKDGGHALGKQPKQITITHYGKKVAIEFGQENDNLFLVGYVKLTAIGNELFPICGSVEVDGFFKYLCEEWSKKGYKVSGLS